MLVCDVPFIATCVPLLAFTHTLTQSTTFSPRRYFFIFCSASYLNDFLLLSGCMSFPPHYVLCCCILIQFALWCAYQVVQIFSGFSGFASEENLKKKKKQAKCAFSISQVTGKSVVFKAGGIHPVALMEGKGGKTCIWMQQRKEMERKDNRNTVFGAQWNCNKWKKTWFWSENICLFCIQALMQ